jgi:hypothetical protein
MGGHTGPSDPESPRRRNHRHKLEWAVDRAGHNPAAPNRVAAVQLHLPPLRAARRRPPGSRSRLAHRPLPSLGQGSAAGVHVVRTGICRRCRPTEADLRACLRLDTPDRFQPLVCRRSAGRARVPSVTERGFRKCAAGNALWLCEQFVGHDRPHNVETCHQEKRSRLETTLPHGFRVRWTPPA